MKFDWTQHMHDRLGDALVKLVSVNKRDIEDFIDISDRENLAKIDIEIRVNGHEIPFDAFVREIYEVDEAILRAAAQDVIEARFGDKLRDIDSLVQRLRDILHEDVIDQLGSDWRKKVETGP